jgi:hypothetical protein
LRKADQGFEALTGQDSGISQQGNGNAAFQDRQKEVWRCRFLWGARLEEAEEE